MRAILRSPMGVRTVAWTGLHTAGDVLGLVLDGNDDGEHGNQLKGFGANCAARKERPAVLKRSPPASTRSQSIGVSIAPCKAARSPAGT
jgi:hypothetical protein